MGSTRVRIAIDAMGGDHAPGEIVAGALRAREELGVDVLLVGDPQQIEAALPSKTSLGQVEIVTAEEAIAMDEEPLNAVRRKRKASINVAMDLVKQQKADAVFSAGSLWGSDGISFAPLRTIARNRSPSDRDSFPHDYCWEASAST
ncbi:hypothetical protein NSTCB13_04485 [Nostoc sp. DSM 114160]|jgi:glycerol-3-phosphate acyltransferase PlsX